jgi:DNA-binding SARP family transcriptional activator
MQQYPIHPTLRIKLLGGFQLVYGATPVTSLITARLTSLLTYLVLHRDAPQARGQLAFLLWPDSTESQARTNLRHVLHTLRQSLPGADRLLRIDRHHVEWHTDEHFALDVADFENAVAAGALDEAVRIYGGDLLPGCYDDWLLPERERLRQLYLDVLWQRLEIHEREGDYRSAVTSAQHLLQIEPLREDVYRALMRLHALNDDRAAALHAYHACADLLESELDVDPSPATQDLYQQLLKDHASAETGSFHAAQTPLVGRNEEWAFLQAAWQAALAGDPRLAVVTGEAGIGKTHLCDTFVAWVNRQELPVAVARCFPAEGVLPYAPIAAWLRSRPLSHLDPVWRSEIARLLPELLAQEPDLPAPGSLTEDWQRLRFYDALARTLLLDGDVPVLLFIDNLQWCDHGTVEWLGYLLRYKPRARLLIVAAAREETLDENAPLRSLFTELKRREQLVTVSLPRLSRSDTLTLAASLIGQELDPVAGETLFQGSEGNPLFVVELARAGLVTGAMSVQALPPRVQQVIEARVALISSPAHELAELAATIGREFALTVLRQAADADEDSLVWGLDELCRKRIIREQGAMRYGFTHERIREVIYGGLSEARRRLLHQRIAAALEIVYTNELSVASAQVAGHYEQAGRADRAIRFYCDAADAASRSYAPAEAATFLRRAGALLAADTDITPETRRAFDQAVNRVQPHQKSSIFR